MIEILNVLQVILYHLLCKFQRKTLEVIEKDYAGSRYENGVHESNVGGNVRFDIRFRIWLFWGEFNCN